MDCRNIEFSPEKSAQRIGRFRGALGAKLVHRILALALYLLGAKRNQAATLVNMSEESLKTMLRTVQQEGFDALRDRRRSASTPAPKAVESARVTASLHLDEQCCVIDFGDGKSLQIPRTHRIQLKTVLLSLFQAGLLTGDSIASALRMSPAHCRGLAAKLKREDVVPALVDKRRGQQQDYWVGQAEKAEIIKHFAAEAISGHATSGRALAKVIQEHSQITLSERTIRWHVNKLGLNLIKKTLPEQLERLKKTAEHPQ